MNAEPRRILVTGAAGFIGHACAQELLAAGFRLTALIHRRDVQGLDGARIVRASLLDRAALAPLLVEAGPFDAVVHCAGLASDVAGRRRMMDANCQAVRNLADCLRSQPRVRLVHISTTDVYGTRDFVDADENTPLCDNLHQAYPQSKILAERYIVQCLPSRYVILRPGLVYGPGDTTILPRVRAFLRGSPFVIHFGPWRGRNRWPLAHVRNVAKAARLAAVCDDALGQAYNVVDPSITTVEEYYRGILLAFLPEKAGNKSLCLPRALAMPFSWMSTLLSRALGRDDPLLDPSWYALHSVSSNLDFSSRKLQDLFARHGEEFVSPDPSNC